MILAELIHAARSLRRSPGLIAVAALSLGLGIGVNTALYSVFQTVFLQPPSAADTDRLVRVELGNGNRVSYPNYRDLSPGIAFSGLAAYSMTSLNWRAGTEINNVPGMLVSPNFFQVLGVSTSQGRGLSDSDASSIVITHEFWKTHLNASRDALGTVLRLNGQDFAVTGVLPPEHRSIAGALGPSIYILADRLIAPQLDVRTEMHFAIVGRLKGGVSREQAAAMITAQGRALERIHPKDNEGLGQPAVLFPVAGLGSWQERGMPMSAIAGLAAIPFVIFGLVLLIACANVAGLLLARGAGRGREIAIRLALGASRLALVRMLLAESFLLALLGAASGLLLNSWLCSFIEKVPLPQAPGPLKVVPDLHALGFALALAILTTVLCGLTPALAATHPRIQDMLRRDSGAVTGRLPGRRILVAAQVAACVVLLFVSALSLRSLAFIGSVDPGFDIDHLIVAHIDLGRDLGTEQRLAAAIQATTAMQAAPAIRFVSFSNLLPLGGDAYAAYFQVNGMADARSVETFRQNVGPEYFHAVGTALLYGREFTTADRAGTTAVAVVNEEFTLAHSLGAAAIGTRVRSGDKEPWLQIVGVVANSKYAFFGERAKSLLYRPFAQAGGNLFVVARTVGPPASSVAALKPLFADMNPTTPIHPKTMRDATSLEFQLRRLGGGLLATVGGLGLGLAMIGLYGIMAYVVNRRTREIGIRMALGATRPAVLRMILRDGLSLITIGLCAGVLIALAAAKPLEFLMSGVPTTDPLTMGAVAVLLLLAGLGASYVPASRATQVAPAIALRSE